MSDPSPLETVKTFLETMGKKDYASGVAMVSADCEYTNPPPLGTVRGPAGIRGVLEPFFAPTLENQFVWKRSAVEGSTVFVERVDRHHLSDGWVELPVTGVFEVHDGRITVWRDYFDVTTILSVWPQPEGA
jgi:limonene-1,2-epoxide hydrolase